MRAEVAEVEGLLGHQARRVQRVPDMVEGGWEGSRGRSGGRDWKPTKPEGGERQGEKTQNTDYTKSISG